VETHLARSIALDLSESRSTSTRNPSTVSGTSPTAIALNLSASPISISLRLFAILLSLVLLSANLLVSRANAQDATPAWIHLEDGQSLADKQEITVGVNRFLVNGEEDFWFAHASLQVWEPLIDYDDHFNLVPGLAKSWELSADGLTWTFHLRDDVSFSNGEKYNADSMIGSIAHAKASSGRPSLYLGGINFEEIYGDPVVTRVDDYTVSLGYKAPRPLLPYAISNHYSAQFWQGQFDENSNFTGLPIGTGPFKVTDWKRDQYIVLEQNENYWKEKPTLTKITVKTYPDENSRLSALKAGEVDALVELGAVLPAQAGEISGDDSYVVQHFPTACNTYLLFNGTKAPFNDVRIRQALSLAIDRDAFVKDLLYGYGIPAKSVMLAADSTFFNDDPSQQLQYDPEKAKQLLNEATGGQRVKVELLFNPPGQNLLGWPYPLIATYLQAILQPIGFDVTLKQQESTAVTETLKEGNYDFVISNSCWATGDPNYILRRTLGADSAIEKTNHGGYNNPEVEKLLNEGQIETDPAKRAEIYKQVQAIGNADVPIAPLFDQETIIASRPYVQGLTQHIAYAPSFETIYIIKHD
jgi:peptide/nickel transport system substrate-binding protein